MRKLFVALAVACALAGPAVAKKNPAPAVQARAAVAFTSAEAKDTAFVWVVENKKGDGRAAMVVRDPKGRTVYSASVALASLDWEQPVEVWTPELARDRLGFTNKTIAELKPDIVSADDAGVGVFWPIEQNDALDRAEKSGRPVLCFATAPGGITCAWYDDATKQGVNLLEGAS
ncbi:MAG: hypothetical protein ABWZ40_12760 [Caulobacterales bacterium]